MPTTTTKTAYHEAYRDTTYGKTNSRRDRDTTEEDTTEDTTKDTTEDAMEDTTEDKTEDTMEDTTEDTRRETRTAHLRRPFQHLADSLDRHQTEFYCWRPTSPSQQLRQRTNEKLDTIRPIRVHTKRRGRDESRDRDSPRATFTVKTATKKTRLKQVKHDDVAKHD